ncbi:uncharacterized protein At4g04775-like [Eutrema salsugineum]|uniref:uncharacterized protein At4g04775-like n=1 Tax=Eutrema salsugineum TaxID=72664 RepID=UPI000CECF84B|nr:uncharacterized protein At4g04775-like [Eutrema salsugineum]
MTLSHSSDSSRSSISSRGRRHGLHGIPTKCFCGGSTVLVTSHTITNPGRRFYTCSNNSDGGVHVWKWWDEAFTEELMEVKGDLKTLEARIRYGHYHSECSKLGEDELKMVKELLDVKEKEAKEVKMVVAVVVTIVVVGVLVSLVK